MSWNVWVCVFMLNVRVINSFQGVCFHFAFSHSDKLVCVCVVFLFSFFSVSLRSDNVYKTTTKLTCVIYKNNKKCLSKQNSLSLCIVYAYVVWREYNFPTHWYFHQPPPPPDRTHTHTRNYYYCAKSTIKKWRTRHTFLYSNKALTNIAGRYCVYSCANAYYNLIPGTFSTNYKWNAEKMIIKKKKKLVCLHRLFAVVVYFIYDDDDECSIK